MQDFQKTAFDRSAGSRERGKFRDSEDPELTLVAVGDDKGRHLARNTDQILEEILVYQKATLLALSMLSAGEHFSYDDVLTDIS